jgi:hypothetical protein
MMLSLVPAGFLRRGDILIHARRSGLVHDLHSK